MRVPSVLKTIKQSIQKQMLDWKLAGGSGWWQWLVGVYVDAVLHSHPIGSFNFVLRAAPFFP